jgi:hypothetical protein
MNASRPVLRRAAIGAWLAGGAASCVSPASRPWVHPTPAQWAVAAAKVRELREEVPQAPFVVTMSTTLRDPHSGRVVDGRGAMAVSPGKAVRMILVGGAGATLIDAWVTVDAWRIAVPALDYVQRGGAEDRSDLPVGFLRWWFVTPFAGTLFAAQVRDDGVLCLLRRGDAVVELELDGCVDRSGGGRRVAATRRAHGRAERVEECRAPTGRGPAAGDTVRYVDESSGLRVEIQVESVSAAPADGDAFRDPDAPATEPRL